MPKPSSAIAKASDSRPGHMKLRRRLSIEVRRQENNGPTPVRNSRNSPMGTIRRLNQVASRLICSPLKYSVILGNNVPHSTAKQLASRTKLLNRKLDSRETKL